MANHISLHFRLFLLTLLFTFIFIVPALGATWISLKTNGQVQMKDASSLDGFSQATWNIWVNQTTYVDNAGFIGKYAPRAGMRSYLLRTSLTNGVSVILSPDGTNSKSYTSLSSRACGIRKNGEWTMLTVSYNGSVIKYYRNGVLCDQDPTDIKKIYNSGSPLSIGGGNGIFFSGSVDEATFYNQSLDSVQILRLYQESTHGSRLGQSIPVLVYHKIENISDEAIEVTPSQFGQQMDYLKDNKFTSITMRDYDQWQKNNFTMPEKPIILVFDDGWKSVSTSAKPIMDSHGFVGSLATVMDYAYGVSGGPSYMRWTDISTLSGWSIESHGVQHAHMLTLNESQFRKQLLVSQQNITQKTGRTPDSFVFPFHESNTTYTEICGEYYDLCWTQGSDINPSYDFQSTNGNEYLSLRRINVINDTTLTRFKEVLGRDTDMIGSWDMDEGSGTKTGDGSGYTNNTGTLMNAFWVHDNTTTLESASYLPLDANESVTLTSSSTLISKDSKHIDHKLDNKPIEEDKNYRK